MKEQAKNAIKSFEELTRQRDVYFHYDHEDGYFIKISDKGTPCKSHFDVAELTPTHHYDMISAMESANEWMQKDDDDFAKVLNQIKK